MQRLHALWELRGQSVVSSSAPRSSTPGRAPAEPVAVPHETRRNVADLLASIDQLRPGLARNRALALTDSDLARGIGECFNRFEVVDADDAERLGVTDETADFVYATARAPADAVSVIGEALRALRLLGVAALDFDLPDSPSSVVALSSADSTLAAVISVDSRDVTTSAQLPVTVTNTGAVTLGSAIIPPRVRASWIDADGARTPAAESSIEQILLPGDSIQVSVPLRAPEASARALLELSVVTLDGWGERGSPATLVTVSAPGGDRQLGVAAATRATPEDWVIAAVGEAGGQILCAQRRGPGVAARRYFVARA